MDFKRQIESAVSKASSTIQDSPQTKKTIENSKLMEDVQAEKMVYSKQRRKIVFYMISEEIDMLFLLETHINTNSKETHDDYCFYFSTSVTDEMRKKAQDKRDQIKKKGLMFSQTSNIAVHNIDAEKHGVGVVFS